jgi:hypothetical protein
MAPKVGESDDRAMKCHKLSRMINFGLCKLNMHENISKVAIKNEGITS